MSTKFLGVISDEHLTFIHHVENLRMKISKPVGMWQMLTFKPLEYIVVNL